MHNRDTTIDGQAVKLFTPQEILQLAKAPDSLVGITLTNSNLEALRYYLKLKPQIAQIDFPSHMIFALGKIPPLNRMDMVYLLVKVNGVQVRTEFEVIHCFNCGHKFCSAHHAESSLYIGLENKWEVLRRNEALAFDLACPNCGHPVRRRSVWIFSETQDSDQ